MSENTTTSAAAGTGADLESTIRSAAQKFAQQLKDAGELQVETRFVLIGDDGSVTFDRGKRPIARTVISIDGDTELIIPMRQTATGALERDETLLDLHMKNVSSAIEYRASLLEALLSVVRPTRSR
jgi:hypothetical protein